MFLKPDSVGIISRGGYRMVDRQSFEAHQWLAYISRKRNIVTNFVIGEVNLAAVPNVQR